MKKWPILWQHGTIGNLKGQRDPYLWDKGILMGQRDPYLWDKKDPYWPRPWDPDPDPDPAIFNDIYLIFSLGQNAYRWSSPHDLSVVHNSSPFVAISIQRTLTDRRCKCWQTYTDRDYKKAHGGDCPERQRKGYEYEKASRKWIPTFPICIFSSWQK